MKAILSLLAVSLAAVALAVSPAAAEEYVPGVTDFPTAGEQSERYVPGVTDFPTSEPAPEARTFVSDGFDWLDAGFGAAIGVALGAAVGAALIALRRRTAPSPA